MTFLLPLIYYLALPPPIVSVNFFATVVDPSGISIPALRGSLVASLFEQVSRDRIISRVTC